MNVGTWYGFAAGRIGTGVSSPIGLLGAVTGSPSTFGPPTIVSLGGGIPDFTGFTDYSQLAASGTWQFDLSALEAQPQAAPIPLKHRTAAQIKAESDLLKQAYALVDSQSYGEARALMEKLLADNKTNASAYHVLGLIERGQGNYDAAVQQFRKAHAIDPTYGYDGEAALAIMLKEDDDAVLRRARALAATVERHNDGVSLLVALTERSPDRAEAHLVLGDALLRDGDTLNGMMQLNAAIRTADGTELRSIDERLRGLARQYPQSGYVQQMIGKVQTRQGNYAEAIKTLRQAAELMREAAPDAVIDESDLGEAYMGLGRQQLERGEIGLALPNLEQARQMAPRSRAAKLGLAEGYLARGNQLMNRRRYAEALADYRRLGELAGKEPKARELLDKGARKAFAIGKTYENKRLSGSGTSYEDEAGAYEIAYNLSDDNADYKKKLAETRNSQGNQLFAQEDFDGAAAAYEKACKLYTGNETYRANAVKAWLAHGDDRLYNLNFTPAIDAYRAAYRIDPKSVDAKAKLANGYNRRGLDYLEQEDYKSAARDFKEAYELFPDNEEYKRNYEKYKTWLET